MRLVDALLQEYHAADREMTQLVEKLRETSLRRQETLARLRKLGYTPERVARITGAGLPRYRKIVSAATWRDGL